MNIPHYLNGLIEPGKWKNSEGEQFTCRVADAGEVRLPSGRVCIGDPYMVDTEYQTIKMNLGPGRYSVQLCIAELGENNERVAGAFLRLRKGDVHSWSSALYEGAEQDAEDDEENESCGYGVDLASSCFIAHEIASELAELDDEGLDEWSNRLTASVGAAEQNGRSWFTLDSGAASMVAFPSGWGDGFYYNWWGLDANGERVVLLTAFDVLEEAARVSDSS